MYRLLNKYAITFVRLLLYKNCSYNSIVVLSNTPEPLLVSILIYTGFVKILYYINKFLILSFCKIVFYKIYSTKSMSYNSACIRFSLFILSGNGPYDILLKYTRIVSGFVIPTFVL